MNHRLLLWSLGAGSWGWLLSSTGVSATNNRKCYDDKHYRYYGDRWKDCKWVYDNNRCEKHDPSDGYHVGKYYCPYSCHYCDIDNDDDWWNDDGRFCYDDEHYRYYGDSWKDCHWVYENDRCDKVRDGRHVGSEYCPDSCGYCDGWSKPSPSRKPTRRPSPTRKPTRMPIPSYCHNSVEVARYCYEDHHPEKLKVYFENCHPEEKDWIGIYEAHHGYLGDTAQWWGNSFMWQFACGSKQCHHPEDKGTLFFSNWWSDLENGKYKAYLFDNNSYHVKASSDTFEVGRCKNHRPSPPTRKPTSHCRSSIEVASHCYSNRHPLKLRMFFENCHPKEKDWIGIYEAHHGHLGNTLKWWGNSFMWQFACGSKTCSYREHEGTLYFEDWWSSLDNGKYKAYLFDNNGYEVKAVSDTFEVGYCH